MLIVSAVVKQLSGRPSMVSRQSVTVWTTVCCIWTVAGEHRGSGGGECVCLCVCEGGGRRVSAKKRKKNNNKKITNSFAVSPSKINNTEETLMVGGPCLLSRSTTAMQSI